MTKLCIIKKRTINSGSFSIIITSERDFVKENCGSRSCRNGFLQLLLAEGLAVSALVFSGIHFVGAHQDFIQRTVILMAAVVGALLNGTLDTLVGMAVHSKSLLCIWIRQ